jgi:hypothetical protein
LVCEAIGTAATPGLLCQPRVIVKMIVESRWNEDWQGKPKYSDKTCPSAICPPQIPHDQTRARTRAAAVGSQRLTAWATARPKYITILIHYQISSRLVALLKFVYSSILVATVLGLTACCKFINFIFQISPLFIPALSASFTLHIVHIIPIYFAGILWPLQLDLFPFIYQFWTPLVQPWPMMFPFVITHSPFGWNSVNFSLTVPKLYW